MFTNEPIPCSSPIPRKYKCRQDKVEYDPQVLKFAQHPRNKKVAFIKHTESFEYVDPCTDHVVRAKGLTKIIKGAFFSNYEPVYSKETTQMRKKRNKNYSRETQRKHGISGEEMLRRKVNNKRLKGFTLGNVVHDELCSWARSTNEKEWAEQNKTLNTFTIEIMKVLKAMKIEPLYGEWPIFDEHVPYATSIDMIGISGRAKGKLVLIEIKTGYDGYFDKGNAKMTRTPLKRVINSPQNQAFIQCLMAMLTLKHRYGINQVFGVVIRAGVNGVDIEPVPQPFIDKSDSVYNALCTYMIESGFKKQPNIKAVLETKQIIKRNYNANKQRNKKSSLRYGRKSRKNKTRSKRRATKRSRKNTK